MPTYERPPRNHLSESYLSDNNGEIVARGFVQDLLQFVRQQSHFDPSYALWLHRCNGTITRVL